MIDKRLIDYSSQYKDYRNKLREESKCFDLEDMMQVIDGFLTNAAIDLLNSRDRKVLVDLGKLHREYQNT